MLNKRRIAVLALAAVMTLGAVGCGETTSQVTEQISLGQEYLNNGDYESAIAEFESMIATDKYAWDAHSGLVAAMVESGKNQEDINRAISNAVDAAMELSGTNLTGIEGEKLLNFYGQVFASTTNDVIVLNTLISSNDVLEENPFEEAYYRNLEKMAQFYIESNNYDAAQQLIDRLKEGNTSVDVAELEKQKVEKETADGGYVAVLTKAADFIDAKEWQALADLEETEELKALRDRIGDVGNFSYTFTDGERTGKTIGYYSMEGCDCNEWYYGDMSNGQRAGYGGWYWATNSDNQLYVENFIGEWVEDVPHGNGHNYIEYGGNIIVDEDATYVSGLKNGTYEIETIGDDGYVWKSTYNIYNGRYEEIEVEEWVSPAAEGSYIYAIAYRENEDGTTSATKWTVQEGSKEGVAHFR